MTRNVKRLTLKLGSIEEADHIGVGTVKIVTVNRSCGEITLEIATPDDCPVGWDSRRAQELVVAE